MALHTASSGDLRLGGTSTQSGDKITLGQNGYFRLESAKLGYFGATDFSISVTLIASEASPFESTDSNPYGVLFARQASNHGPAGFIYKDRHIRFRMRDTGSSDTCRSPANSVASWQQENTLLFTRKGHILSLSVNGVVVKACAMSRWKRPDPSKFTGSTDMFFGRIGTSSSSRDLRFTIGPVVLSTPTIPLMWEGGPYTTSSSVRTWRVAQLPYKLPDRFCLRASFYNNAQSIQWNGGAYAILTVGGNVVWNTLAWPHNPTVLEPLVLSMQNRRFTFGVRNDGGGSDTKLTFGRNSGVGWETFLACYDNHQHGEGGYFSNPPPPPSTKGTAYIYKVSSSGKHSDTCSRKTRDRLHHQKV